MSRFARAPERSSPRQCGQSVPLGLLEVDRQRRQLDPDLLAGCLDEVGQAGIGLRVVVPVHREERVVAVERPQRLCRATTSSTPLRVGEQMPGALVPRGRYSVRTTDPSGPSHVKAWRSIAAGTPRHTTACSMPANRRICGIWRDVAEHVRQVADPHRAAELVSASEPVFQGCGRSSHPRRGTRRRA